MTRALRDRTRASKGANLYGHPQAATTLAFSCPYGRTADSSQMPNGTGLDVSGCFSDAACGSGHGPIQSNAPGAAQLIGRQGPYALDAYAPSSIDAEVPPDPSTLRASIESSLSTLLTVLALAGLVIGLVSIGTVTTLSVAQRRSEIGPRRALGYRRSDVFRLILAGSIGVGVLGGIVGTSLGVPTVSIVAASRGWTPVLAPQVIALAPALGIAVGIVAGSYPGLRSMSVTPVSALRSA